MPGNIEEKEKCLEKLNQMQKFLPFLDFMIDKIKKKNSEISLECQLSKFQLLRSMIAEKSKKYDWDVVVKVEDVIEKLIAKLDFKEQYEKPKEKLVKTDSQKPSMATSVSIVPSSAANNSSPQVVTTESKSQDLPTKTVGLLTKTLKLSSGGKSTDVSTELPSNPSDSYHSLDVPGKTMDTDLDKDLDGFDLTDCPSTMETSSGGAPSESNTVPGKSPSHDDLLTSSREKLLKSLQSRLYPTKTNHPTPSLGDKTEKENESETVSAFSHGQTNVEETKTKSECPENSENSEKNSRKSDDAPRKVLAKQNTLTLKSCKPLTVSEKPRTDSATISGDSNLKQKLKEKLSTDICEVYKVPGKSVGGSLRCLKESKEHKKSSGTEEEKSGKSSVGGVPDKNGSMSHSRSSTGKRDNQSHRSHRNSSAGERRGDKNNERESHKHGSSSSDRSDKKCENNLRTTTMESHKTESSRDDKSQEKKSNSRSSKGEKKSHSKSENRKSPKVFDMNKLNDEELLDFVKENIKSLPHLAKLKPEELRKAIQNSATCTTSTGLDADGISEISDDSFQDLDEIFVEKEITRGELKSKTRNKEPRSFESVKSIREGGTKIAKSNAKSDKALEIVDLIDDLDDISLDECLDEDDYALKLIEETTLKTYPKKKKELPNPSSVDLFDDISSIENFETENTKDSRLQTLSEGKNKPNKAEVVPQVIPDKPTKEILPASNPRSSAGAPKEVLKAVNPPTDVPKTQRSMEERLDPRVNRSLSANGSQDVSQLPQCAPTKLPAKLPHNSHPRRHHSYTSSEPKSYAEYKHMKLKGQEKMLMSKEGSKNIFPGVSDTRLSIEGEGQASKKISEQRESVAKQNPKGVRTYEARKKSTNPKPRRSSDQVDGKDRNQNEEATKKEDEKGKKLVEEKRHSVDSEELVSPLEELYRNDKKPKTGRGYGLQNFKIPKKMGQGTPREPLKAGERHHSIDSRTGMKSDVEPASTEGEKVEMSQVNVVEPSRTEDSNDNEDSKVTKDNCSKSSEKVESTTECTKTDNIIKTDSVSCGLMEGIKATVKSENVVLGSVAAPTTHGKESESTDGVATVKTENIQCAPRSKNDAEEEVDPVGEVKTVKKCGTRIAECDSSVERSLGNDQSFGKDSSSSSDKNTVVPKEEITQEFVEALIRKSFQSGEGKLLLAQVKLFEEFARKLNSKKLKTIQKIINSESDSSSSTSETTSEDEKKKKKSKRRKKKCRKNRKHKSSSSSSSLSSENDETSEDENCDRGGESKKSDGSGAGEGEKRLQDTLTISDDSKSKSHDSSTGTKTKNKRKRRNAEFGRHFSRRKAKRKQKQKKLLEKILNEAPKPETSNDSGGNSCDVPAKDSEPKNKSKPKGKCKTELDRLHEDIRSMFISEGMVTATGKRMCRILNDSGGNMNNLDIVKESAKMVEEEKLKKVQTRSSQRISRFAAVGNSENRSRSQSLDKGTKVRVTHPEIEKDPKLSLEPRVCLQRVDLDNFGYGVKISDDCISFRRMQGRNTAIRGKGTWGVPRTPLNKSEKPPSGNILGRNVFLARNKRKFERLKDSKCKKGYKGKKLMEVVKNLPLKMAKMKHLQFCENKTDSDSDRKKKSPPGKFYKATVAQKNGVAKADFSNVQLLQYAFEKKRKMYRCKLCSHVTKNITMHYKGAHPDHEVLISRLSLLEASKAKLEAKKLGDGTTAEKNTVLGAIKRNMKVLLSRSEHYNCRMCPSFKIEGINDFATHVSAHTGEFRFQCPAVDCTMQFYSRHEIKFHILTKHPKNRSELSGKVAELYPLTIEGNHLLGFLCSICHFVQINRRNLEDHVTRQHGSSKNARIIKINMSSMTLKKSKKKSETTTGSKSEDDKNEEEESEVIDDDVEVAHESKKSKMEDENSLEDKNPSKFGTEDGLPNSESQDVEGADVNKKETEQNNTEQEHVTRGRKGADEKEIEVEGNDNSRESVVSSDAPGNDGDMEDCVDLLSISTLKGSDIVDSLESVETRDSVKRRNPEASGACEVLKVGPLEAQIFKNSEVLYECYVKGCLFSTRLSNLFERHIEISHIMSKWNGVCDICARSGRSQPLKKPVRLISALRHLQLHEVLKINEEANGSSMSPDDLILKSKLKHLESTEDDEESENPGIKAKGTGEVKGDDNAQTNAENTENPFPAKPLLRVRNFLGDRLSTPKAGDTDVAGKVVDEDSSPTDTSTMFTIENVRSLKKPTAEEGELKIEQVCSLKDQMPKTALPGQLSPGKAIIVRSCPTRKIAIRPETGGALAVDAANINVVQSPVVGHPVVLGPLSRTSPIRIISAALSPKPKFTVKPIMVAADGIRFAGSNAMPVISPGVTSALKTTALIPVSTTGAIMSGKPIEGNAASTQTVSGSPLHVDLLTPQISSSTPPTPSQTSSDAEEGDEKDTIVPQKMPSSLSTGKKSLKDAKIYQEMLTKTKLCHFFKCMGMECSFTCDDENVFLQHIGLHEVQRRMSRNKGVKMMYLRLANRMTKAFYWQQCAYCCEVLNNSISALSQHIREEHGHCIYQCAFCFYRAVSHSYVKLHQNLTHSHLLKTAPRLIYKCKPLKPAPTLAAALEKHGRRQSVRPYHCDQCGRKFFITGDFINHLSTEHQSVTAYTCHICKNLCFKINRLINHYKMHSYSTYQCPYCIHGTETEREMVFHLCNFHFSQPPVMYVRALAEGQNDDEKQKPNRKKKPSNNQLESLKVIVYENDNLHLDCIVEVNPDLQTDTANTSEASVDVTSIAAELGINTDAKSSSQVVTPLMKELASIGEKGAKNITVKTLLPNAQFSSETEKGTENCSVLISSGLSIPTDQNEEREMNIPLGQLPLEAVNVQHKEPAPPPPPPPSVESPDRNLKLNELIVNLQQKEKTLALAHSTDEDKIIQPSTVILSSAVHKLPPVVLTRNSTKNIYPSKCVVVKKKPEEPTQKTESDVLKVFQIVTNESKESVSGGGETQNDNNPGDENSRTSSTQTDVEKSVDHPLITNVVSLSGSEFHKEEQPGPSSSSIVISDVCSLSDAKTTANDISGPSGLVINIKPKISPPTVLKPPIIRVEDFPIEESKESTTSKETPPEAKESKTESKKEENPQESLPASPEVVILEEEKTKNIVTVTLDSDDERDESAKRGKESHSKEEKKAPAGNETIRKEMELLRKQIANETDSLLLDEPEAAKPTQGLRLNIQPREKDEDPKEKTLLSPIEEAICSLNKKLQSETEEAQKKKEEREKVEGTPKPEEDENKVQDRPRTRFGTRDRKRDVSESSEKTEGDEGNKKEDSGKKRFREELVGKELFICGNEKCNFAAEDDSLLRDHLLVCDLSRESSVLVCPHCSRQIKQFHAYLEHLKYHGEKKFHCGLCTFSSAVDQGASRHVKQKHKCSLIKVLPKESKEGHFVYYPKNYKVDKVDFEVNGYSPGDEDKLPLQSVYQVNVKCAKCPYFTKVRSNMVRHLKIHVKSVETEGVVVVPSTAPTNPVPCLESKERMFDKMTNLAASSQLAQAKERAAVESLSPEEEAKLPQFVPEQMRYKCCLPDCNYITVDDGMLKHHIKALHDEISYYSCPHCQSTVHADIRNVTLDKIGFHLRHHDSKLYKCAHCIFFHYQKNVVEKHMAEKHSDRRYFLHTVRQPKGDTSTEEEPPSVESGARVWKCGLCDSFQTPSKPTLMDHLMKSHNTKSKYKCQLCQLKGNSHQLFTGHFASKHPGEKVTYVKVYFSEMVPTNSLETQSGNSSGADSSNEHFDTTPLWQRGAPRIRHIRGILIEEEEIKTKRTKRMSVEETSEGETSDTSKVKDNAFYCPLCTNKKKPFYTRSEEYFRTHLYQELNYQQFACILCGKMFVDRKDFEKHHARSHPDKVQILKQTKEDNDIKFWVDQVIEKRRKEMEDRKRKLSEGEGEKGESQVPPKKLKEV